MAKPKSAYSIPTKRGKLDTHIFVVWVDNEAGVLARVVGLFSGRGYNIESLAVAEVDQTKNISRITIVTTGTPQVIDQIKLQLKKFDRGNLQNETKYAGTTPKIKVTRITKNNIINELKIYSKRKVSFKIIK